MQEICLQKINGLPTLFSAEDKEKWDGYQDNQIVRAKITGIKKPRSYIQLKLYWTLCNTVADNTDDPMWNTKSKVDFQCRVGCHFVERDLIVVKKDGSIAFQYKSIAFANLGHIEATNYFERAFDLMAKKLGVTVDKLMEYSEAT